MKVDDLPRDASFFSYQNTINPMTAIVPSHNVIDAYIRRRSKDYRFEVAPNPVPELRDRKEDNTCVGRIAGAAYSTDFWCNE